VKVLKKKFHMYIYIIYILYIYIIYIYIIYIYCSKVWGHFEMSLFFNVVNDYSLVVNEVSTGV